jgi:hypothetical protein
MQILSTSISLAELHSNYCGCFESMCKAVVDIDKGIIAVDAELHADLESLLLENGSMQEYLWGINLYPLKSPTDFIEYTSLINIRPHQGNFSMEVQSEEIKKKIQVIAKSFIPYES